MTQESPKPPRRSSELLAGSLEKSTAPGCVEAAAGLQTDIPVPAGINILQSMMSNSGLDADTLNDAAGKGAVWLSQQQGKRFGRRRRIRSLDKSLDTNALINLNFNTAVLAQRPLPISCVLEQVNYGIWHKPPGMLCQGSKWSDHTTATQVAANRLGKPCHLVHRLDKSAQGLLLMAYTANATRQLCQLFERRQVEKIYHVWIDGPFNETLPFEITNRLEGKHARTMIKHAYWHDASRCTRLMISIETGRKHQIRQHLAQAGYPVIGDRLYGKREKAGVNLQLQASAMNFKCPFSGEQTAASLSVADAPPTALFTESNKR